eukprot:TRINITY_DN3806_c0_g2_i6.p1 TRINITY_DN3806_c0_g2~~TRINITY_DN3806_c0_g2_i6.p1  ORF type:complete len:411 (+),score=107.67 TRINITY_DN3806_c0_g2_i6:90-1235(+)
MYNYKEEEYVHTKTGNKLRMSSENNYLFPLGEYKRALKEIYDEGRIKLTENMKNQVLTEISSIAQSMPISRSGERMCWGLPVPEDKEQMIYVWFDALINYYTVLRYPNTSPRENELYSNIIHIIGKDILRFHTIVWPAFLLANDYPLPKEIIVHNFWLTNRIKMSKSLNNVVKAQPILDKYGSDLIRWYFLKNGPFHHDETFLEAKLYREFNLKNEFANTISRIVGSSVMKNAKLIIEEEPDLATKEFVRRFNEEATVVYSLQANPVRSVEKLVGLMRVISKYIDDMKFWSMGEEKMKTVVGTVCEALRATCVLLYPVVPEYTLKAMEFFDMKKEDLNISKIKIEVHKRKEVRFNYKAKNSAFIEKMQNDCGIICLLNFIR